MKTLILDLAAKLKAASVATKVAIGTVSVVTASSAVAVPVIVNSQPNTDANQVSVQEESADASNGDEPVVSPTKPEEELPSPDSSDGNADSDGLLVTPTKPSKPLPSPNVGVDCQANHPGWTDRDYEVCIKEEGDYYCSVNPRGYECISYKVDLQVIHDADNSWSSGVFLSKYYARQLAGQGIDNTGCEFYPGSSMNKQVMNDINTNLGLHVPNVRAVVCSKVSGVVWKSEWLIQELDPVNKSIIGVREKSSDDFACQFLEAYVSHIDSNLELDQEMYDSKYLGR